MSRSASKIRECRSGVKDIPTFKLRRASSMDLRGYGSYAPEKKRSSSEERKSNSLFGRFSNSRKSSINQLDGKRMLKDSRPLSDRNYQKRKIVELVKFLEENDFKYPVNVSKLASPSKKDFEMIFQFLYNFWYPQYTVHKLEEEAPKILKGLCYPFTVNKSSFLYVARTNWPSLLGVLIWLMDMYKFAMNLDMKLLFKTVDESEALALLSNYICLCHFSGKDDEEEEDAVFRKIVKSQMTEDIDELEKKIEEKTKHLQKLQCEMKSIQMMQEENERLSVDISKYEEFLVKMESHMKRKESHCSEHLEVLKQKEVELDKLQKEVDAKQSIYEAQGFDGKKQLNYLEGEKKELMEKIEQKQATFKKLQDNFWEMEVKYAQTLNEGSSVCETFNELYSNVIEVAHDALIPAQNVKIPQVRKWCKDFQLEFPDCKMLSTQHSYAVTSNARKNALEEIRNKIKTSLDYLKGISSVESEKKQELLMTNSELSIQLKLLQTQKTQSEQELEFKGQQSLEELATFESQYETESKVLGDLRSEKLNLKAMRKEIRNELDILKNLKKKKEKELEEYLHEVKELFQDYDREEEDVMRIAQMREKNILKKIQEVKSIMK